MKALRGDRGATLVEYALILGLVAVVCIGVISWLGDASEEKVDTRSDSIGKPVESNALTGPGGGGGGGSSGTTDGGTVSSTGHIGTITGTKSSNPPDWSATVTVTVVDNFGAPIPGLTITGSWSTAGGGTTCSPTSTAGSCPITSGSFKKSGNGSVAELTFTVTGISGNGFNYDSDSNTSSSITITAP
jgi:Flp pilus assembly pilin Flp